MGQWVRMRGVVLCHGAGPAGQTVFRFLEPGTGRIVAILLASEDMARQLAAFANTMVLTTVAGTVVRSEAGVPPLVQVRAASAAGAANAALAARPAADPPVDNYLECVVGCIADKAGEISIEEVFNQACGWTAIAQMPEILTIAAGATAVADLPAAIIALAVCTAATFGLTVGEVVACFLDCAGGG